MLQALCEDIWTLDHPLKLAGVQLGARMTLARVGEQGVLAYSPVPVSDEDAAAIAAHGEVRWVVAPSLFHHLYAEGFRARFPQAALIGAPGLGEKRPALKLDGVLDASPEAPWASALEEVFIAGMPKVNETVFFHRAARTLMVCDAVFNMTPEHTRTRGWWTRLFLRLTGSYGGPAQSRLLRSVVKDRAAFAASMRRLLALDIERIVVSHGAVIEADGRAALARAARWALPGQPALAQAGGQDG